MQTKTAQIKFDTKPAIYLSANAVDTIGAVGVDSEEIQTDIDDLLSGAKMPGEFRAECLNGAVGADVIEGWNEYVDAIINCIAEQLPESGLLDTVSEMLESDRNFWK